MADLNKLFLEFNSEITLTNAKKENLKKGRDALRKKIKDKFEEANRKKPKFCGQGSYMMKTTVNPIEGEYDLDDGVYIQGYSNDESEWPATTTIHKWIKDAVDGHTSTAPIDKNTCVRVVYVDDYHIDLPAYIMKDDKAYLAHKQNGWIVSDPKSFTEWFVDKVTLEGEQLRRIVKYLKAWKEYKDIDLKGISITILVGENYGAYENRDDLALLSTLSNIIEELENEYKCKKPVAPNEDLFENHTENKKNQIMNKFIKLKTALQEGENETNEEKASEIMIEYFGKRFPKGENKSSEKKAGFIQAKAPAVLKNDGRSA